ncbi:MAG: LysR family transcriptional regulator [Kofleriaceae bacterium]
MTMTRYQRVAQLWNWLPGFRGVAEHQSVHKAAHALGISPSALSRTVKLLESALGADLFVRQGTGMQLTAFGAELLTLTRDVMRQFDDCIARDHARRGAIARLSIGVACEIATAVVCRTLVTRPPTSTTLDIVRVSEDDVAGELLRGNLDLVVTRNDPRTANLASVRLGEARFGIYAAADHELAISTQPITTSMLEAAAFIALNDGPQPPRTGGVACTCDSLEIARALCETSSLLCALPDVLVAHLSSVRRLADAGDAVVFHAVHREPIGEPDEDTPILKFVSQLRATLA